jgi:hypothetical protein
MLLLRPIMALSTSGAKGSVGSNSLSASASVAAILPRDSHRTFFEVPFTHNGAPSIVFLYYMPNYNFKPVSKELLQ